MGEENYPPYCHCVWVVQTPASASHSVISCKKLKVRVGKVQIYWLGLTVHLPKRVKVVHHAMNDCRLIIFSILTFFEQSFNKILKGWLGRMKNRSCRVATYITAEKTNTITETIEGKPIYWALHATILNIKNSLLYESIKISGLNCSLFSRKHVYFFCRKEKLFQINSLFMCMFLMLARTFFPGNSF